MHLSLIQRIALGFITITCFVLAISTSAYLSQVNMSKQLELTASTLTGLLDRSNALSQDLQNVNRSMLVHANSEDEARREELRTALINAEQAYNDTTASFQRELKGHPHILEQFTGLNQKAQIFIEDAESHLDIHDQRISARTVSSQQLSKFDEEWLFFEQDMSDLIADAQDDGLQQTVWDLEYLLAQGKGAAGYLQKVLTIAKEQSILEFQKELTGYLSRFNEKAERVSKAMPSAKAYLESYQGLLELNIVSDNGLLQEHAKYIRLNDQSTEMLALIAREVDDLVLESEAIIAEIRLLSENALQNAKQESLQSLTINIMLAVISVALAVIITVTVIRSIKKPLSSIMHAIDLLASGNLNHRIDGKYKSELGLIADNVNGLSSKLSGLISQIKLSAETVSQVADESQAMSQKTNDKVSEQRRKTDSMAAAVTEMEHAVHEVASHAADTNHEVDKVTVQAQSNMENMQKNLRFVQRLQDSLNEATVVIQQLSAQSLQIGEILTVIQSISEQTNLLALNAAIEAARAGEYGRGFAVVADEVRSLATRTQQSANEIGNMIDSLQNKADQAVGIVENNLVHAEQSVKQTNETNDSLAKMVSSLTHINDMSRSIATASEQQSAVAQEVAQNIVSISDMTSSIAEDAEEVARNSQSLNKLSIEQNKLISQFTV